MATMIVRVCDVDNSTCDTDVHPHSIEINGEKFEIDLCNSHHAHYLERLLDTLRLQGRSLDKKPRKSPVQTETECPECGETFKSKSGMGRHRTTRHKKEQVPAA